MSKKEYQENKAEFFKSQKKWDKAITKAKNQGQKEAEEKRRILAERKKSKRK